MTQILSNKLVVASRDGIQNAALSTPPAYFAGRNARFGRASSQIDSPFVHSMQHKIRIHGERRMKRHGEASQYIGMSLGIALS